MSSSGSVLRTRTCHNDAELSRSPWHVESSLPEVHEHLDGARADVLAFTASSGRRSSTPVTPSPGGSRASRNSTAVDRIVRCASPPHRVK
jgi:hypothetical protein